MCVCVFFVLRKLLDLLLSRKRDGEEVIGFTEAGIFNLEELDKKLHIISSLKTKLSPASFSLHPSIIAFKRQAYEEAFLSLIKSHSTSLSRINP